MIPPSSQPPVNGQVPPVMSPPGGQVPPVMSPPNPLNATPKVRSPAGSPPTLHTPVRPPLRPPAYPGGPVLDQVPLLRATHAPEQTPEAEDGMKRQLEAFLKYVPLPGEEWDDDDEDE